MTRNAPEPDSAATDPPTAADAWSDADDLDAAELEEREDSEERERQKARSAVIGLVALILVIVLAGVGFWASVSNVQQLPNPEIARQVPPQPPQPPR